MLGEQLKSRIVERFDTLTEAERALGEYFLAHAVQAAFWPASKFGRAVGVSEATVVRFARSLDYESYGDLQQSVQGEVEAKLRPPIAERFEGSLEGSENEQLTASIQQDLANLREVLSGLDGVAFERATEYLTEAPQLFVAGMRASAGLATYAAYVFGYLIPEATLLSSQPETQFDALVRIRPGAVLIAFAFARNSRRTIEIAEVAKERSARVIVFTDSPLAPIAKLADALIVCPTGSATFVQSTTAVLSILNGMLAAVSTARSGPDVAERMGEIDSLLSRYSVVAPSGPRGG